MQCSKAEDDQAGQRTDPGPKEISLAAKNCEGGEVLVTASAEEKSKASAQDRDTEPDPVSRHSTRSEEKQTENIEENRSESFTQFLNHQNASPNRDDIDVSVLGRIVLIKRVPRAWIFAKWSFPGAALSFSFYRGRTEQN